MIKLILAAVCAIVVVLCSGCTRFLPAFWGSDDQGVRLAASSYAYDKSNYPLTLERTNSAGEKEVTVYQKPPERVIAVWQNSIETLMALGVGDRIVAGMGVPGKDTFLPQYQEQFEKIPVKGLQMLDLETTLMLKPDLIVGWNATIRTQFGKSGEFWHKRGVNTYIALNSMPNMPARTLENEYNDILHLGQIFAKNSEAKAIVDGIKGEIAWVTDRVKDYPKKPRVLIIEYLGKQAVVCNEKTIAGDIVHKLQGELVGAKDYAVSFEQLVEYDPDVLFVIVLEKNYGREQEIIDNVISHPALKNLRCVQNKRIHPLLLYEVYCSGVRTADGVKKLAQGIYPEIYDK